MAAPRARRLATPYKDRPGRRHRAFVAYPRRKSGTGAHPSRARIHACTERRVLGRHRPLRQGRYPGSGRHARSPAMGGDGRGLHLSGGNRGPVAVQKPRGTGRSAICRHLGPDTPETEKTRISWRRHEPRFAELRHGRDTVMHERQDGVAGAPDQPVPMTCPTS